LVAALTAALDPFDRLGEHYEQLGALIGEQAAIEMVIAALGKSES
jgi:hypothetical protein